MEQGKPQAQVREESYSPEKEIGKIVDINLAELDKTEVLVIGDYTYIRKEKLCQMMESYTREKVNEAVSTSYAEGFRDGQASPIPSSDNSIDVRKLAGNYAHEYEVINGHTVHPKTASFHGFIAGYKFSPQPNEITDLLHECRAYFLDNADADHDDSGYVPNKEMKLLETIDAVLKQSSLPSSIPTEEQSLNLLEKAHWHGWFVRERYNGPDRHGYEPILPTNWSEMDYDEHEEWFFKKFKELYAPLSTEEQKEERKRMVDLLEWMAEKRFAYISDDWKTPEMDWTSEMVVGVYLQTPVSFAPPISHKEDEKGLWKPEVTDILGEDECGLG